MLRIRSGFRCFGLGSKLSDFMELPQVELLKQGSKFYFCSDTSRFPHRCSVRRVSPSDFQCVSCPVIVI